jgi:hypothetical protein
MNMNGSDPFPPHPPFGLGADVTLRAYEFEAERPDFISVPC